MVCALSRYERTTRNTIGMYEMVMIEWLVGRLALIPKSSQIDIEAWLKFKKRNTTGRVAHPN